MIYDIRLVLAFDYASPVSGSRQRACMMPTDLPGQRCTETTLSIEPAPDERRDSTDFFGNRVTQFAHLTATRRIALTMQARVERLADPDPAPSVALRDLAAQLRACRDLGPSSPLHHLAPSFRVPLSAAMTRFARAALPEGAVTAREAALAVCAALHRHMRFDTRATTVDTPAAEAFARRSGVCQDFSHIAIACLRGIGIPAGYVSGFLRTRPPPGRPRLEGADAMHAWVRVWTGAEAGWMEIDPTNNCLAGSNHITVAHGRDYADVAPIKGSFRIAGGQRSQQSVDVVPVGEA